MQWGVVSASPHHCELWSRRGTRKYMSATRRSGASCVVLQSVKVGAKEERCGITKSSVRVFGSGFLGLGVLHGHLGRNWNDKFSGMSSAAGRRESSPVVGVFASMMVDPIWVIRTAAFYLLLETGIAGRGSSLQTSDLGYGQSEAKGPLHWIQNLFGGDAEQKRNKELAKVRSKWQASIKGTLVRRYRVPSKAGGRKLLTAISSLLADDDTFRDVATHKGCQIRRENAHAESVCCHNVRALFDELPTPHLVVEITVFPAGPITAAHYEKADKIEKVLRTGVSI